MMKNPSSRFVAPALCGLAAIAALLIEEAVLARQNPPTAPVIKDPKSETRERQDREATLRSAEVEAALDQAKRRPARVAIEEIKHEYRRIQILRNEIAHLVLANHPFDFKVISDKAAAVNKSADRLKTQLRSGAADKPAVQKNQDEFNRDEFKGALVRLCKLIDRFVENPALKNPDVTDVQHAIQAVNDLLSIIELSGNVKRSAEKLKTFR